MCKSRSNVVISVLIMLVWCPAIADQKLQQARGGEAQHHVGFW